jgi:hypothetical protein
LSLLLLLLLLLNMFLSVQQAALSVAPADLASLLFLSDAALCCAECSACPHTWFPYCANSGQYGPSTFANCCFAKCNNVPIIKSVLHAGVCLDKCAKCDASLERPLCCKGRTYKNGCYASCNEEDTSQCSAGRCSNSECLAEAAVLLTSVGALMHVVIHCWLSNLTPFLLESA